MRHKELSRSLMCFPMESTALLRRWPCSWRLENTARHMIYQKSPNSHTKVSEVSAYRKNPKHRPPKKPLKDKESRRRQGDNTHL